MGHLIAADPVDAQGRAADLDAAGVVGWIGDRDVDEDFAEWRTHNTLEELEKIDWSQETELDRRNRDEETRL